MIKLYNDSLLQKCYRPTINLHRSNEWDFMNLYFKRY